MQGTRADVKRFSWQLSWLVGVCLWLSPMGVMAAEDWSDISDSGDLRRVSPDGEIGAECPLRHTDVRGELSGFTSRVWVTQTFENTSGETIEALYTFPLPAEGAVDDFQIHTASGTIRGELRRRGEARQIYARARSTGHLAALLEQERPNVFTQSVANLPAGETIRVELSYVAPLRYVDGAFEFAFPTVVGPRFVPGGERVPDARRITPELTSSGMRAGHDIRISLEIDAGVPIDEIDSRLHEIDVVRHGGSRAEVRLRAGAEIPNRDFVLRYGVASESLTSGYIAHRPASGDGYATFLLLPPERIEPREVAPRELVFLVDRSGSQAGRPLEKAKATILWMIEHLHPGDVFQVVSFSDEAEFLFDRPQPATAAHLGRARRYVRSLQANGGTWMAEAVQSLCAAPAQSGRLRIITLVTDGYVGNDIEVLDLVRNSCADARWFPFGTGNSVNRFLLDTMAKLGRGEVEYVLLDEDEETVARRFQERIDAPVLTDVRVEAEGLELLDPYPSRLGDLWAQRPVMLHARYAAGGRGHLSLRGRRGDEEYVAHLEVQLPDREPGNSAIASMWARSRIDALLAQDLRGWQSRQLPPELEEAVVETALAHRISTPFTSFVAVDPRVRSQTPARRIEVPVEVPQGTVFAGSSGRSLEEITVTARKREENLQATPVSISAFSETDLKDRDIRSLQEITQSVPNLTFDVAIGQSNSARIYLRGVGNGDPLSSDDPGVGVYVDGVYLPRAQGALLTVSDIERVEVLRGPQGTLFGKNTIGGAVNVINKKPDPSEEMTGSAEIRRGNYQRFDTRFTVSLPLVPETAAARISIATGTRDPVVENESIGSDFQDDKLLAGRLQLLFRPSDEIEVALSGDHSIENRAPAGGKCVVSNVGLAPSGRAFAALQGVPLPEQQAFLASGRSRFIAACAEDALRDARSVASDLTSAKDELKTFGSSATITWNATDDLTLKSITGWQHREGQVRSDLDYTVLPLLQTTRDAGGSQQDAYSQELQLTHSALDDRLNYVVGLYGFREDNQDRDFGGVSTTQPLFFTANSRVRIDPDQLSNAAADTVSLLQAFAMNPELFPNADRFVLTTNPTTGATIDAVAVPGAVQQTIRNVDNKSYAAYTQGTFDITEQLSFTAGLRFTHERRRVGYSIIADTPGAIGANVRRAGEVDFQFERSARFDDWSPMVNLSYQPTDALLFYANYSKGFKSGGFNGRANTDLRTNPMGPDLTLEIDDEKLTAYEIGMKSSWLDERLVLNVAGYWNVYEDIQLTIPSGGDARAQILILNAGESILRGAEVEIRALQPIPGLEFSSALGVTNARYTEFDDPQDARAKDRHLPGIPTYTGNLAASYTLPVGSFGDLRLRAEWTHRGRAGTDVMHSRELRRGKNGELDAQIALRMADGWTEIVLFGRNLLNREFFVNGVSLGESFGHSYRFFNDPRTYGIEIRRLF